MAVAGKFYPNDRISLKQDLDSYFNTISQKERQTEQKDNHIILNYDQALTMSPRALIVPHAGYIFSGVVAASAFARIPENTKYHHIFLLGPSHYTSFHGASVCNAFDEYATPLGKIPVDKVLCNKLIEDNDCISYHSEAHDREHCLEVELPFLQHQISQVPPIIPIIIGTENLSILQEIGSALKPYFTSDNLFIISSDFSHYPSYDDAEIIDQHTAEGILSGKKENFIKAIMDNMQNNIPHLATSACGEAAIYVLLMLMADSSSLTIEHTLYLNSGDSPYGEKGEVVGYHGFCIKPEENDIKKNKKARLASAGASPSSEDFLNDKEKKLLLYIARQTILGEKTDENNLPEKLHQKLGAFVTLTEHEHLRGCIGHFGEDYPLYKVVKDMAHNAAFDDPRFMPVKEEEMSNISIEISVLTPLKCIHDISEFNYGHEGIYIRKGFHSGTFLPQVADEVNWTKEEFLGHCAQDKAGIGWNGWQDAELYTYKAIIFKET